MTDLVRKFNSALRWNMLESIWYKAILTVHQFGFFWAATPLIYGFSSIIFALVYLIVEIIGFGFDRTTAQYSGFYFSDKHSFQLFFLPQLIIHLISTGLIASLIWYFHPRLNLILAQNFGHPEFVSLPPNIWFLITAIIFCEVIRKSARMLGQLFFINKPAAILEMGLILLYIVYFWSAFLISHQISLYTVFVPLLAQSVIGFAVLFVLLRRKFSDIIYQDCAQDTDLSWSRILQARKLNFFYQLSEMPFGSNFLIYFLSLIIGVVKIGQVKLANYLAVFIKTLLERSLGLASLASMASASRLPKLQRQLFDLAQRKLYFLLGSLSGIFLLVISAYLLTSHFNWQSTIMLALLFFGFTLINNFFIIYEQFLIIQHQIRFLLFANVIALALTATIYYKADSINPFLLLAWLTALRMLTFLFIRYKTAPSSTSRYDGEERTKD